jgi:hypothetical protein
MVMASLEPVPSLPPLVYYPSLVHECLLISFNKKCFKYLGHFSNTVSLLSPSLLYILFPSLHH